MMTRIRFGQAAVLAASLLCSFAVFAERAGTPEKDIGLGSGSPTDIPTPVPTLINTSDPGDLPIRAPLFAGGPPMVPHGVVDFLPITWDRNDCVDCHAVEEKVADEATPIPSSHYTDMRNLPGEITDSVTGARYVCVSCHVSPGDNEELVGNSFGVR